MDDSRWSRFARWAALIGVLCMGVGVMPATASGGSMKTVTLTGHWVDPPQDSVYIAPNCDFEAPPPGCRVTNTGHSEYTGDWAGISQWQNGILIARNTIYVQGIETFQGHVKGCGTGTMTWTMSVVIRGSKGAGTFSVIPSLGTGDLRHIRGSGTLRMHTNEDTSNHGRQHGQLRCRKRR
jgi:Protein of unknown function (DUF3224)